MQNREFDPQRVSDLEQISDRMMQSLLDVCEVYLLLLLGLCVSLVCLAVFVYLALLLSESHSRIRDWITQHLSSKAVVHSEGPEALTATAVRDSKDGFRRR